MWDLILLVVWGMLEAEAGGEVEVAIAVVEAVAYALIPVPLVVDGQGIEKVAGGAHEGHLGGQVGGE